MTFKLNLIDLPDLERIDGEVRHYKTPEGNLYPSVTSVLSATGDKGFLDSWADRIGHEEAAKITAQSGRRGSAMHELLEKYVLNEDIDFKKEVPTTIALFKQIKKFLDPNLDEVLSSEGRLYSDTLKVAGSVDLVARWKGKMAIVDFKTSRRLKKPEWIWSYCLQTAMYAYMVYERTGILCPNLVILIAIDDENHGQCFEFKAKDYLSAAKAACETYHKSLVI